MYLRFLVLILSVFSLSFAAGAADVPLVTLGGEVGAADKASLNRFSSVPFDSLAWIRADLTGEKASESDDAGWGHILFRPFKNYSGDISGRFIEIMAMNARGDYNVHPAFKQLLADAQKQQRMGGYFAASGQIDWQKPVDYKDIYTSTMMPALWGNARLLCGLVEASRSFPKDESLLATARRLGDFYVGMISRFTDPARMSEYKGGDTYAAGYVTCYFPAMEGLAKLHALTGDKKYLEAAVTMAAFYKQFDRVPIDHAHGMLCNQVSLVLLYQATKDASYLERVEKRWDELVTGGYINPAGGIMEQCKVKFGRDEGCAIVDWLRLNLALGRVTGKTRYWAMAERTLHNHFLQNQTPKGGFGHRGSLCDQEGVYGFSDSIEEAVWCCTFHGQLGFVNLRSHLLNRTAAELTCYFAVDFIAKYADGLAVSDIRPVAAAGEVLRQRIRLDGLPATVLRVRQPHWADAVTALAADGTALGLETSDGYCLTTQPVSEATFIYAGGLYAEDRHCKRLPAGPVAGAAGVIGYGPKLLAAQGRTAAAPTWPTTLEALKAQGLEPFTAALRNKECCFVSGPLSLADSAKPVWGTSRIAEPYPYVSTGSFSGPAVPESPDPLVAYRWPSPKATDGLEIYLLKPSAVSSDTAASFDNLGSLTTDHPNVTVNGAGSIRMDFGRESAAWLEFDSPDCPGDVEMSISEYNQPGPEKTKAPVKHGNTYRLELNTELYEGVRFAWIHVKAPAKPWHITGIRAVCQVKPTNYDGGFSCSDPMLTKAWYMSAYGVKVCLVSNYFSSILLERGDRIPWVGDAPASQAAGLVAFGNSDFVKANIDLTAGGNNGIIAYSLYWVIGLLDYYQYTGDAAMMEKYLNATCEILDHSYQVYGTNPKLKFFGWDERVGTGFEIWYRGGPGAQEAQNAYKMLSIRMWSDFAAAMGAYGRADLQAKYNGYAEAKMAELRKNRDWHSRFGLHALAEVAASGRLNDVERKAIAEKEFHDRVTRLSFDPFCQLFINQAMACINLYDEAFTSIRDVWGGIIKLGGTTPWECYRPSWNSGVGVCDPVPNSQSGITSLCHPWGAGPVKWLNEEVLGIKPTTPGFKTFDVVPHLGRSLTRVAGKTPTPHGEISASFDVNTGTCKVTAPAGTVGRIGIPKVEKTISAIAVNGTKAWDGVYHAVTGIGSASQDSEFVYLSSVQPGTYSIEVSYSGNTPEYKEPPEKYAAQFIKQDKTTGGDWGGVYGKDGYVLCNYKGERNDEKALPTHVIRGERAEVILDIRNDEKALPSYVTSLEYFRAFPKSGVPDPQMWAAETADKRALAPDKHNGSGRKATGYSNDQTMSLTIGIDGEREYQVALYFVDWNKNGCRQAVEMMDAGTLNQVAPVKIVDDFSGGAYLVYQYNKSAKFRINKVRGPIASLSGIFFDPASATFDSTRSDE